MQLASKRAHSLLMVSSISVFPANFLLLILAMADLRMKAGNVNLKNSPLLSCAAGVDCSGYVSRAWGLTSKLGTWDIANVTEEIDWKDMKPGDVYLNPGVHVALYRMNHFIGKVYIAESNSEKGLVIEQIVPITWLRDQKLLPQNLIANEKINLSTTA